MKIDSGLSGYPYPTRSYAIERVTEEATQRDAEPPRRSGTAITGSSTLLSSSLANALWGMGSGEDAASTGTAAAVPVLPVDWVEELYLEFSDNR